MTEQIKNVIRKEKLIAIVRGVESEKCIRIAQALYDGGIRLMEITYDQKRPEGWEDTARTIGAVGKAFEGKMYVGAGTVTCPELAELTHKYGGRFIISPDMNPEVIRRTVELGMVSIPGAMTPTEIQSASVWGADFVKLFPASTLGPEYLRAVRAPLSHVKLLAVGGITPENIPAFSKAGAVGFGIGTNILDKEALRQENYTAITELATSYLSLIRKK